MHVEFQQEEALFYLIIERLPKDVLQIFEQIKPEIQKLFGF